MPDKLKPPASAAGAPCGRRVSIWALGQPKRLGRPGWVKAPEPVAEKGGSWLFRGVVSQAASLAVGLRVAEADARKRPVGQISEGSRAERRRKEADCKVEEKARRLLERLEPGQ